MTAYQKTFDGMPRHKLEALAIQQDQSLSEVRARCTELLEENRVLQAKLEKPAMPLKPMPENPTQAQAVDYWLAYLGTTAKPVIDATAAELQKVLARPDDGTLVEYHRAGLDVVLPVLAMLQGAARE